MPPTQRPNIVCPMVKRMMRRRFAGLKLCVGWVWVETEGKDVAPENFNCDRDLGHGNKNVVHNWVVEAQVEHSRVPEAMALVLGGD